MQKIISLIATALLATSVHTVLAAEEEHADHAAKGGINIRFHQSR